jgi:Fur family transcriptional regulator, ferric uptake regulator
MISGRLTTPRGGCIINANDSQIDPQRDDAMHLTSSRQRVLNAIHGARGRHLDAREIAEIVNRKRPDVHLATVYRALQYLTRQGLVSRVLLNEDHVHYEAAHSGGVHLVCTGCGGVREIAGGQPQRLLSSLGRALRGRFEVADWQMQLVGTCRRCSRPAGRGKR